MHQGFHISGMAYITLLIQGLNLAKEKIEELKFLLKKNNIKLPLTCIFCNRRTCLQTISFA